MDFSQTIKQVLADKNRNPSDLARMTGYTPQYIYGLLKGRKRWNEEVMRKVCTALNLEIKVNVRIPQSKQGNKRSL